MSIFDRINADVQTARNAPRSTIPRSNPSSHSRSQSSHSALHALADAAHMTPQRREQSVNPSRQADSPTRGGENTSRMPLSIESSPMSSNEGLQRMNLRRMREDAEDDTSEERTRKRRAMEDFTRDLCSEYDIPTEERTKILGYSQLSPKKLMMVVIVKSTQAKQSNMMATGLLYLASKDFKEYIISRLHAMMLDPGLWSYKVGLLERCLRHIRLNPSDYRIPPDLISFIPSNPFTTAVSKALVNIRAELKRQLADLWKKNKDICLVVGALSKKTRIEPTDAIWGRWAWVQLKLVDFSELVTDGKGDGEKFWDWIDTELAEVREKHKDEQPAQRIQSINLFFSVTLYEHHRLRPVLKAIKSGTKATIPAWQVSISAMVVEIGTYEGIQVESNDMEDSGQLPDHNGQDQEDSEG